MTNETRNELLTILSLSKKDDQEYYINELINRIELDLEDQLKDLEYKKEQIENNLDLVMYVRNEINKGDK